MKQTTQTPAEIARILGYEKITLATHRVIAELGADEIVIGTWHGTARYTGPVVMRRIGAEYPAMHSVVVAAYGRSQGNDLFAVIAKQAAAAQEAQNG